jgi:hypothetical protein
MKKLKRFYSLLLLLTLWSSLLGAQPNNVNASEQPQPYEHVSTATPESSDSSIALLKTLLSILTWELIALSADEHSKIILNEQYSWIQSIKKFRR